jgi:hypothetical protein
MKLILFYMRSHYEALHIILYEVAL